MRTHRRFVTGWLLSLCLLIICMIVIGGITRLTGSGLSIVDWNPIMGAIPPLTEASWQAAFAKYQQYPQYKLVNLAMTLHEFKLIFFWEYLHRLLGRFLGVGLLVPLLWLTATRSIDRRLTLRILGAFVLGGLQGALGWFMVKSGLVDRPEVSHYRLAAHLLLAFLVLAYLFRIALEQMSDLTKIPAHLPRPLRRFARALPWLVGLQVVYGALVAGLHAGHIYNTFPTMNGEVFPSGGFALEPLALNFFENPATVQFVHRCLAWLLLGGVIGFAISTLRTQRMRLSARAHASVIALIAGVSVQFALGVLTLVLGDPIALASLHQLGATLLFLAALWARFEFSHG